MVNIMKTQELNRIIENLNQLAANRGENGYLNESDILGAIHNEDLRTGMLDLLIRNNIPYALARISGELTGLAHRIYGLEDYEDSEEKYLNKTLRTLDSFKSELQRIQEYVSLLRQVNTIERSMMEYREAILEGASMYDYKCSLDNIKD